MKHTPLSLLLRANQTVFSLQEIAIIWGQTGQTGALKGKIRYYVQKKELYPVRKALYAKDKNYNRLELATKIFTPSYVSFETVLAQAGIIFQHYTQIFLASYQTRSVSCDGQTYSFRKIKELLLTDSSGIEHTNNTSIASPERAFLDTVYLHTDYHFDNLAPLHWDTVFKILPLYQNKQMEKRVQKYYDTFQQE